MGRWTSRTLVALVCVVALSAVPGVGRGADLEHYPQWIIGPGPDGQSDKFLYLSLQYKDSNDTNPTVSCVYERCACPRDRNAVPSNATTVPENIFPKPRTKKLELKDIANFAPEFPQALKAHSVLLERRYIQFPHPADGMPVNAVVMTYAVGGVNVKFNDKNELETGAPREPQMVHLAYEVYQIPNREKLVLRFPSSAVIDLTPETSNDPVCAISDGKLTDILVFLTSRKDLEKKNAK